MNTKKDIEGALKKVIDPHTGINVVDMGLIKNISVSSDSATIHFVPTTPFCPMVSFLTSQIENATKTVKGVKKVKVLVG